MERIGPGGKRFASSPWKDPRPGLCTILHICSFFPKNLGKSLLHLSYLHDVQAKTLLLLFSGLKRYFKSGELGLFPRLALSHIGRHSCDRIPLVSVSHLAFSGPIVRAEFLFSDLPSLFIL